MSNKIREGGNYSPLGKTKLGGEDFNCGIGTTKGMHRRSDRHNARANSKPRSAKCSLNITGDTMNHGGSVAGSRRGPVGRRHK